MGRLGLGSFTGEFKGPHPVGVPLRGGMCRPHQIHLVLEGVFLIGHLNSGLWPVPDTCVVRQQRSNACEGKEPFRPQEASSIKFRRLAYSVLSLGTASGFLFWTPG